MERKITVYVNGIRIEEYRISAHEKEVFENVDAAIIKISKEIQHAKMTPEECSGMANALAALLGTRGNSNI